MYEIPWYIKDFIQELHPNLYAECMGHKAASYVEENVVLSKNEGELFSNSH